MASATSNEVVYDLSPLLKIYSDGRIERLYGTDTVPASVEPVTGVQSKDVKICLETGVSARIYIPKHTTTSKTLPLLVYFHGGGFCNESAFSPTYHNYLNSLVAEANVVVVSVDYRLAPEHPLPTAYEDSWVALKWVACHSAGHGPEPWLNDMIDFQRVFIGGDSSGGNQAHNMAIRIGSEKPEGMSLTGMVLIHPYFWGKDPIGAEGSTPDIKERMDMGWMLLYPGTIGLDDPVLNPDMDPKLSGLGCSRVLIFSAEKDPLRDRAWHYHKTLGKCGWGGVAEIIEVEGEGHTFHLPNPIAPNAVVMLNRMVSFLNMEKP